MNCPVAGFDFHFHADLFPDPAAAYAACDRQQIVTIAVTTTPKAWRQNRTWAATSRYVHAALGLHPELVGQRHDEVDLLESLIEEARFVGEVGLDGSPQHRRSLPDQARVFARTLSAAQAFGGRVISVHSRRAGRDVLNALRAGTTPDRVLPVLHWFSDSAAVARQAVEWGCLFSVNHRMLGHAAGEALIRSLPADRILTESDAPFTSTDPNDNSPADILGLVRRLATLRSVSPEAMHATIAENAARVFAFAGIAADFEPATE